MKKKRSTLIFSLLLFAAGLMAQTPSLVPAMIVHGTNGSRQVMPLETTAVTDLVVLQNGQTLSVDISGTQISGIKSIAFAMVESSEVPTDIGQAENTLVRSVEKIMRDGQVILRLHMQNGALVEYDMRGNKVINNK